MNVISPTGCVHQVESDGRDNDDTVVVVCHHHYGGFLSFDISVDWETTNQPVTCKRCIAGLEKEKKMTIDDDFFDLDEHLRDTAIYNTWDRFTQHTADLEQLIDTVSKENADLKTTIRTLMWLKDAEQN